MLRRFARATKVVGQPILIGETICAGLVGAIAVEAQGPTQFKTRKQPVEIYSVPPGQRLR